VNSQRKTDGWRDTLSHKRHDFRREGHGTQYKCFDFHYNTVWNVSQSKKNWARRDQTYIAVIIVTILMILAFSWHIFRNKYPNIKFNENPPRGSRVVPSGRTDGQRDITKLTDAFSKFCERGKSEEIFAPAVKFTNTLLKTLSILTHATTHLRNVCVLYRALWYNYAMLTNKIHECGSLSPGHGGSSGYGWRNGLQYGR